MNEIPPGPGPSPVLIAEATKRSGIVWVQIPGQARPRPAWHIWRTVTTPGPADTGPPPPGAAYLVTGPGEQPLPGLSDADRVTVTVRGGVEGGVVTWTAEVGKVEPGGAEWNQVIGALVAARLNPPPAGTADTSPAKRWAREGAVFRLAPVTSGPAPGGRRG